MCIRDRVERVHAGGGRRLGQTVGLDQGAAGDLLPAFGDRALDGHAAAEGEAQGREIDLVETRGIEPVSYTHLYGVPMCQASLPIALPET